MKAVYLEDLCKGIKRFICGVKKGDECYSFYGVETISEKAFASSDIKQVLFEDTLERIRQDSFKDCEKLENFCCGKVRGYTKIENSTGVIKNYRIYGVLSDFTVETSSFACCNNLHTVIFPQCKTLKIEKNAFAECSSLRTVVAFADKIEFTENPFSDCPKNLAFVCKSNSDIERFARENGYRYINV